MVAAPGNGFHKRMQRVWLRTGKPEEPLGWQHRLSEDADYVDAVKRLGGCTFVDWSQQPR